jgi:hypothetical protein
MRVNNVWRKSSTSSEFESEPNQKPAWNKYHYPRRYNSPGRPLRELQIQPQIAFSFNL